MNRRQWLRTTLSWTAAGLVTPCLLASDGTLRPRLRDAWNRASRAGRALLVLPVVAEVKSVSLASPTEASPPEIGRLVGAWLNHAPEELLARLAGVEVVCAEITDLDEIAPSFSVPKRPVLIVLEPCGGVDGANTPPLVSCLDYESSDTAGEPPESTPAAPEFDSIEPGTRERLIRMSVFLRRTLDAEFMNRSARRARDRIEKEVLARLDAKPFDLSDLTDDSLRSIAPILLARGLEDAAIVPILAEVVRRAIVKQPPAGAKWVRSEGCTTIVEGEDDKLGIECGMAVVPPSARRFLQFMTSSDPK